ncbi:ribbon-helix-helix protein, CopG family [Deinococcus fonticola]|uniref:ribbon-helix-helix protein, CopG family n=1 Tax=Deinococcus fonticola TaxID=2528713 RepID=UPI003B838642
MTSHTKKSTKSSPAKENYQFLARFSTRDAQRLEELATLTEAPKSDVLREAVRRYHKQVTGQDTLRTTHEPE